MENNRNTKIAVYNGLFHCISLFDGLLYAITSGTLSVSRKPTFTIKRETRRD